MPRLDVYANTEPYLSVPLDGDRIRIGRAEDCEIRIPSAEISRHHATLHRSESGHEIEDTSRNGTRVNSSRVLGRVPLAPGDRIYIGDRVFIYQPDGADVLRLPPAQSVTETRIASRSSRIGR